MRKFAYLLTVLAAGPLAIAQAFIAPPFFTAAPTPYDQQVATSNNGLILRARMNEEKDRLDGAGVGATAAPPSAPLGLEAPTLGLPPPAPAPSAEFPPRPAAKPAPTILDKTGITFLSPLTP